MIEIKEADFLTKNGAHKLLDLKQLIHRLCRTPHNKSIKISQLNQQDTLILSLLLLDNNDYCPFCLSLHERTVVVTGTRSSSCSVWVTSSKLPFLLSFIRSASRREKSWNLVPPEPKPTGFDFSAEYDCSCRRYSLCVCVRHGVCLSTQVCILAMCSHSR